MSTTKGRRTDAGVEAEVLALATITQDGHIVRGKIPVPVVKALKAQVGDVLAFERRADGAVVVRKASAAERKQTKRRGRKAA